MTRYIGVAPYLPKIGDLKRAALLFDTIALSGLDDFLVRPYLDASIRADLAWMTSEGLLVPACEPEDEVGDGADDEIVKEWLKERHRRLTIRARETQEFGEIERRHKKALEEFEAFKRDFDIDSASEEELGAAAGIFSRYEAVLSEYGKAVRRYVERFPIALYPRGRAIAAKLNTRLDQEAVVITPEGNDYRLLTGGREQVLRVLIHQLPVPSDGTPWEAVRDFRADSEAQVKLARLRAWANSAASTEDPRVIRDQIEASIVEYTEHMRLHELAHATSVLEIVLTGSAMVIEDLTRLHIGSAAKRVFELRKSKVQLMRAEAEAPGRALAYLIQAKEKFKAR